MLKRYVSNKDEFVDKVYATLKLESCPKCNVIGMLILHGFLQGYNGMKDKKEKRAFRIYCSNRNKREGCGKTFSVYMSHIMKGFMSSTHTLWNFLLFILSGLSFQKAYDKLDKKIILSIDTFYYMWDKFKKRLHDIRQKLSDNFPLNKIQSYNHITETINHVSIHLNDSKSIPIDLYQHKFQCSFL